MKYFVIFYIFSVLLISGIAHSMSGSAYDPPSIISFEKSKLNYNGLKSYASVPALTTQDIDLTLADDNLLTGAQLSLSGNCNLDEVQFKVVSGTTVVNQFIDWYATEFSKDLPYPAKIPTGLKLRVTYKNTCSASAVSVKVNYFLHKVLQ